MLYYTEKAVTFAVVFLMTIAFCSTTIQEVRTQFVKNKVLATSYATKQPISQLHCVQWCSRDRQMGKCKIAGYNKYAKACRLSMDNAQNVMDVSDEMSGVYFLEPMDQAPTCGTEEPLVGGATPIPDVQMTASSEYGGTSYQPHQARLHGPTAWCPSQADMDATVPNFYLQIFPGNLNTDTVVSNTLETPVTALCLRLYPLVWNVYANVRLEVKGCSSV